MTIVALERELVDAIRAAPYDDAPRLVYADWLLERGDQRGALIHAQCLLASAPTARLRAKTRGLLARVAAARPAWAGAWPPPYVRGFATSVVVRDTATFRACAAEIGRSHPLATIALADNTALIAHPDGERFATLQVTESRGGSPAGDGQLIETVVTVFDRDRRVLFTEQHDYSITRSNSSESEDGEVISRVAFTPDGASVVLTLSGGTILTRLLPVNGGQ